MARQIKRSAKRRAARPKASAAPIDAGALVEAARKVRERAYSPYSKYKVGAALLAEDGRVFLGVNVENSAYPSSLCAEHNAIGNAVAAGARAFRAIAVCTELDKRGEPGPPCGKCRQVLSEFGLDLVVLLAGPTGDPTPVTLQELFPRAFSADNI